MKGLPVADKEVSYPKPSAADVERERAYRAESDIRTLREAAEIKGDRDRMRGCKEHAKKQMKIVGKA